MLSLTEFLMNKRITEGAAASLNDIQFMEAEIRKWLSSKERQMQIDGENYYEGNHDILHKTRSVKDGKTGIETEIVNLPNSRIVDNQYRKLVNQKKSYLMGSPFSISTDNEQYAELLEAVFDNRLRRTLKNVLGDAYNGGKGWLYVGYDDKGELSIKRFRPYEILPFWSDSEHTVLDAAIRCYEVTAYDGKREKKVRKVEVYDSDGIRFYESTASGNLYAVEPYHQDYITISVDDGEKGFNWSRIPLIAFKANENEVPMIKNCKALQDGINQIESAFEDNMLEDARNTVLVLVNYDGQNLAEFRQNLALYGAVKVNSDAYGSGDVKSLQVQVNADNYKSILKIFKDALIENAMGYDAKDDRLNGNPNQMNIQSMYSDIDLDADDTETEFKAAFEELVWFINCYLFNTGKGDFSEETVDFAFSRNVMMNNADIINNIKNSVGIVSDRTLLEHHPFVTDVDEELKRIEEQSKLDNMGYVNEPTV